MRNEKQTGVYSKRAGTVIRLGRLICIALLLAGLGCAVPLAGQATTPSAGFAPQITGGVPPGSVGEWRWMSGSSTEGSGQGQPGVYGTEYMPLGTNVPGAREGAPSWIDSSGNLWLFGGYGFDKNANSGFLNDVWVFNPSNLQWAWMAGSSTLPGNDAAAPATYPTALGETGIPGGRQGAVSWTDKSGNFWLFGGLNGSGDLNDLWEFTPNLNANASGADQWTWMSGSSTTDAPGVYPATMGTFSADNVPGARQDAMTWTDSSGNLWLFGGEGYDSAGNFGELNDLWEFSPTQGAHGEWAWMSGSSTIPPYEGQPGVYGESETLENGITPGGRYGAAAWTDSFGNFWLFGGEGLDAVGNSGYLNDLWEYDPYAGQWAWWGGSTAISGSGWPGVYGVLGTPEAENIPGGRDETASWIDSSNHLWLFGGDGVGTSSTGFLNDLWAFDSSTNQWVWQSGSGTPFLAGVYPPSPVTAGPTYVPGSRLFSTSWTDLSGNLWLFGGTGYDGNGTEGYLNDLWEYTPPTVPFGGARATETPQFSVASGTYTATQSVSITDNTFGATIYYTSCTTSGCIPPTPTTTNSSVFNSNNPITISSGSETLEAIAIISGQPTSAVGTAVYTVTPPVATPTFNPPPGPVASGQTITISDATLGAIIYYTTNGSAPSVTGTLALSPGPNTYEYTGPITVSSAETIEAIATKYGSPNSAVAIAAYTISGQTAVATPTFSPAAGTYTSAQTVTISDATTGSTIYYTTDGNAPGFTGTTPNSDTTMCGSNPCGPITVSSTETIMAIATASGYSNSAVASALYTINLPVVAAPTFSPVAGTYTSAQQVTINDATTGSTIYYTTDGNAPGFTGTTPNSDTTMCSSNPCGPITVSSTKTIKAIATAGGYSNSAVATATYTITPAAPPASEWTWVAGSSTEGILGGQKGMYSTSPGSFAAGIFPGSREGASSWTDKSGNLWLFGGIGYDAGGTLGFLNDMWEFNPSLGTDGEWAWMGGGSQLIGGSDSGLRGFYGTQGTPSIENIPGGRDGAASWIDSSGNLWLFGGNGFDSIDNQGDLNDLWEFTPSTGAWTWVAGSSTAYPSGVYPAQAGAPAAGGLTPGGRGGASSWTDLNGNFWLFGGYGYNSAGNESLTFDDLWEFNPSIFNSVTNTYGEWAWMGGSSTLTCGGVTGDMECSQTGVYGTQYVDASTNAPGSRWGASSWTDSSGNLWLFGGQGYNDGTTGGGWLSDLWEFSPSVGPHGEWAWMGGGSSTINSPGTYPSQAGAPAAIGLTPGSRYGASQWTDSSGNFWLLGGNGWGSNDSLGQLNDLWEFNPSLGTHGEWALMGGSSSTNQSGVYDAQTPPASGGTPGSRSLATGWTDNSGNFWLFGGGGFDASGSNGYLNDLWEYSPTATASPSPTATPTFSPVAGTYTSAQTVTISDATTGSTIYYTTDGNAPGFTGSTPNSDTTMCSSNPCGPITVSSTETIKAIATASGYSNSAVASAAYTINLSVAATPTFSPVAGTYTSAQQVTINDATTGSTIYYTTDGNAPGFTGTTPNSDTTMCSSNPCGPITVSSTETINAIATASGYSNSAVASAAYTINISTTTIPPDDETITVTDTVTFPDIADAEPVTVTDTIVTLRSYTTIAITPSPASFNASSSAIGTTGQADVPVTFAATGGTGTLTLSESGTLPSGITFSNGALTGTPAANSEGTYTFSITATDKDGDPPETQTGYTLTIRATPVIAWATPAAFTYGTPLSTTQLDATSSVAGSYAYTPSAGTVLNAGTQTLSVTFTPNDTIDYTTATATVQLTVSQASATVTLSNLTQIYTGSPLSVSVTTTPSGVSVACTYGGSSTAPANAGTYAVVCIVTDPNYQGSASGTLTIDNPVPVITSLSPAVASAGGSQFTLTVNGSGFVPGSTVYWGSTSLSTTINLGLTRLTAQIPATDITMAGIDNVTVVNPAPGGGTSSAFQFEVDAAGSGTVTIPNASVTVAPGASTPPIAVTLPAGSTVVSYTCLNLPPGATCTYSSGSGVTIVTSSTTPPGTYYVTVVFTLTEPGSGSGFILLPILLLPLLILRRKIAARAAWFTACVLLILLAGAVVNFAGCASPTHQATSSGVVTLTVN